MEIRTNSDTTNFKAIQLSRIEANRLGHAIRQYRLNPTSVAQQQILDIFTPLIEKEVALAAEKQDRLSINDYAQSLYLKLFEKLGEINIKFHPVYELINSMNEIKPSEDDFLTMGLESFDDLTPEEEEKIVMMDKKDSTLNQKMCEVFSKKLRYLPSRGCDMALEYLKGGSIYDVINRWNLSKESVQQILNETASYISIVNQKGEYYLTADRKNGIKIHNADKGYVNKIMEEVGY